MSSAYSIVLERKIEGFDEEVSGKTWAKAGAALDALAQKAGVRTLIDSFSVLPEEAAGLFEDEGLDLPNLPSETWSAAEDGAKTLRALVDAAGNAENPIAEEVVQDLKQFQRVLDTAQANGIRWHLAVDY
jgi:hypothetical protein